MAHRGRGANVAATREPAGAPRTAKHFTVTRTSPGSRSVVQVARAGDGEDGTLAENSTYPQNNSNQVHASGLFQFISLHKDGELSGRGIYPLL